jgi:hypothetical protein
MREYKFYIAILLITLTALSCTKVIDLKLGNETGKFVIEANVTNKHGQQFIQLSQNVPFTSTNTYPPVTGATVTVSDNNGNTFPFVEGPAGSYYSAVFAGVAGNTYTMTVSTNGTTYTASSIMPARVPLDSLTFKKNAFKSTDDLREITVHYQDPPGIVNQYRFIMTVNSVQVKDIFVLNDAFSDGRYVDFDLVENNTDIHPNDTVTVEMQCIDKPVYTYWFALSQQQFNNPGGEVAPSNPPTNITPVCLGYFSAHTTQRETIIVK